MAILCCCGQLRARKRPQNEDHADLPIPPPPAKLPPPVLHPSAVSPRSTLARSSLTCPLPGAATDASVHLGELVLEESEDDDVDEDPAPDSRNRSTSTLLAVKSRIRRHLSQDSLQRQSETEEQIAHRAEVKRLMRKRIQEELESEADNVPSRSSTPQRHLTAPVTLPVNGPRDTIEFTVDESHKSKELTPTRVAHMIKTDEMEERRASNSPSRMSRTRSFQNGNCRSTSAVASEPDWMDADSRASQIECHVGLRERSSLPDIPNSPVLLPVRGSAFHDASSLASWRLSLSADKLADLFTPDTRLTLFRPLANTPATCSTADLRDGGSIGRPRSKSSPSGVRGSNAMLRPRSRQPSLDSTLCSRIPASKSLIRDESPVGLWLRTQSMQFRPSTASRPQSENGSEGRNGRRTANHQIEPEDRLTRTPTRSSLFHHADTYQHLHLPGSPSSCHGSIDAKIQPLETSVLSGNRGIDSLQKVNSQSHHRDFMCSAMPSGPSRVSPGPDLRQPSETSHVGTLTFHPSRKVMNGLRLPSFKWTGLSNRNQESPRPDMPATLHSEGSSTSFFAVDSRRVTTEAGSETSSFLRREAELQTVEERFRNSHLRKGSLIPVESKFREIFDLDDTPSSINRGSLLSKLHLNVPKRGKLAPIETWDGQNSGHVVLGTHALHTPGRHDKTCIQPSSDSGHLKVPAIIHGKDRAKVDGTSQMLPINGSRSRRLRGFSSSRDGDDAAELWKRAVRAESASRSPRGSTSSNIPGTCLSPAVSEDGQLPKTTQLSGAGSLNSSRSNFHSPLCKAHPEQSGEAAFRESLRKSTTLLEDWVRLVEGQDCETQEQKGDRASTSCSRYRPRNMPPSSWSKFPSFNRDERNAAAGDEDNVKSRDFAVKNVSASGKITWATDRVDDDPPSQKGIARTFSDKFSQTFKSRLSKLIPGRSRTPSRDRSIRGERRSSIQIAGDLEYPELEILSTAAGYRELCALETEIHEMRGIKDTKAQSTHNKPAASQPRPSLAEKMASAMQQHDGCSDPESSQASDTGSFVEEKANLVRIHSPETPALQIRYPDTTRAKESTGSTVERYATPFSHLSSSANEASRSGTPDFIIKLLPSAHSPSSIRSAKSLMRRASLRAIPDIEACTLEPHDWQVRDDPRRRSVSRLVTSGSG